MPQTADHLAYQLRSAVLVGDHGEVSRLSAAYTEALSEHWSQLSAEERTQSPIPKQSLELLAWVRQMTLVQQALTAEQLSILDRASRYQTASARYLSATLDGRVTR